MKNKKKLLYKIFFIILSVCAMLAISKIIADIMGLEKHLTLTLVIGGSLWAWLASIIFDSYSKRRQKDTMQQQLLLALNELKEIKSMIKK